MTFAQATGALTEPIPLVPIPAPPPPKPGVDPLRSGRRRRSAAIRSVGCSAREGSAGSTWGMTPNSAARSPSRSRSGPCPATEVDLFLEEARRLARLKHPGIVSVYDVGVQDGLCFIVSDFVAGTSLREWLKTRRPTPEQAAEIVASVADALDHAHNAGTIHRDVKPANIMLDGSRSGRSCSTSAWP